MCHLQLSMITLHEKNVEEQEMPLTGTQESEAYYDRNSHLHPRQQKAKNSFRVHKLLEQMCTICMRDIKIAIEKYC